LAVPTIRDEAVCIRHWDWSETSQTVSLLTREYGVLRGVAKGAKRERSNFSGGLELLTRGEVQVRTKAAGSLSTLTSWDLLESYPVLRSSLSAHRVAMNMADVSGALFEEGDPHPRLYDGLVGSLRGLQSGGQPGMLLVRFQWMALGESGYRPELMRDADTGAALPAAAVYYFSARHGGLVSGPTPGAWRVRKDTVEVLRGIGGQAASDSAGSGESLRRAARLLASYMTEILGRELRSGGALFGDSPASHG
jgi:DNA repair protein RecO (recombination protein O)